MESCLMLKEDFYSKFRIILSDNILKWGFQEKIYVKVLETHYKMRVEVQNQKES